MSYTIYGTDQSPLVICGNDAIAAFLDRMVTILSDECVARYGINSLNATGEVAKKQAESIIGSKKLKDKLWYAKFFMYNGVNSPFDFEYDESGGMLSFFYSVDGNGRRWDEGKTHAFLEAFAPHARKGDYVGLVGEDHEMWSYVFDGEGSFHEHQPTVDWNGSNDGELADRLLAHVGHAVEIAYYGDRDHPRSVTLEDLDSNEVILDSEAYTVVPRTRIG